MTNGRVEVITSVERRGGKSGGRAAKAASGGLRCVSATRLSAQMEPALSCARRISDRILNLGAHGEHPGVRRTYGRCPAFVMQALYVATRPTCSVSGSGFSFCVKAMPVCMAVSLLTFFFACAPAGVAEATAKASNPAKAPTPRLRKERRFDMFILGTSNLMNNNYEDLHLVNALIHVNDFKLLHQNGSSGLVAASRDRSSRRCAGLMHGASSSTWHGSTRRRSRWRR